MLDMFIYQKYSLVCLLGVYRPIREFSLVRRRHHYRWRAASFDLCSALMTTDQWWFLSVPHLLWQWPSVYKGNLRVPMTLTPKHTSNSMAYACVRVCVLGCMQLDKTYAAHVFPCVWSLVVFNVCDIQKSISNYSVAIFFLIKIGEDQEIEIEGIKNIYLSQVCMN